MILGRWSVAIVFTAGAACLLAACAAGPAPNRAASAPVACPESRVPAHVRLHGRWRATWGGQTGWLVLGPSPENPDGWRGTLHADRPGAAPVLIAGDLDEQGQFTLEESSDGRRISANWDGQPVEGTCLAEVRGLRREAGAETGVDFVLRREGRVQGQGW